MLHTATVVNSFPFEIKAVLQSKEQISKIGFSKDIKLKYCGVEVQKLLYDVHKNVHISWDTF